VTTAGLAAASEPSAMSMADAEGAGDVTVTMTDVRFAYPAGRRSAERAAALDGLSLRIGRGQMVGLVGPNGSGKSTALRLMMGAKRADAGSVRVLGMDPAEAGTALWSRTGVVFQSPALDGELTVMENLRVHAGLCGLAWSRVKQRANELLDTYGLAERRRERVERLSGGQRRRVELAKALLSEPELLLLDEPTAGLDPEAVRDLWDTLDALRAQRGLTIVVSTHLGDDAMRCDEVVLMDAGRALANGRPADLIDRSGGDILRLELATDRSNNDAPPASLDTLSDLAWQHHGTTPDGDIWQARAVDAARRVPELASTLGDRLRRVTVGPPGLADVFASLRLSTDQPPD